MSYTPGDGLSYIEGLTPPADTDPVSAGASYIRDILAYLKDPDGLGGAGRLPINFILFSDSAANPNTYLGYGTWEALPNRFLLPAGPAGSGLSERVLGETGGAETVALEDTHLPETEFNSGVRITSSINGTSTGSAPALLAAYESRGLMVGDSGALTNTVPLTSAFGDGTAHNNMPPFQVVHVWKRTA